MGKINNKNKSWSFIFNLGYFLKLKGYDCLDEGFKYTFIALKVDQ